MSDSRAILSYWIVYFFIFLGIAGGCFPVLLDLLTRPYGKSAVVYGLDENSDNEDTVFCPGGTLEKSIWMDFWVSYFNGFFFSSSLLSFKLLILMLLSIGEFEMTTTSVNNFFIQNGMLYTVPTLTSDNITGHTFNITSP
jgi:hypothetical protein